MERPRDSHLALIAAAAGAGVWLAVSALSGRREAWDSGAYFVLGLPALALAIGALTLWNPDRPWRWVAAAAAGQLLVLAVRSGDPTLLPLGLVVMGVLSTPLFLVTLPAARLARRAENGSQPRPRSRP